MTAVFEFLRDIDDQLLLFINGHHSPVSDMGMWVVSKRFVWIPFYLLLTVFLIKKVGWKNGLLALFFIGVTILSVDQLSASVIRPFFCRFRPSSPLNPISGSIHLVFDYRGGSFGFPSCHSANSMALAVFLSMILRRRKMIFGLFIWVFLISFSRVYLGVHYPSDVAAGFIIGSFCAVVYYSLYCRCKAFLPLPAAKNVAVG